MKNHSPATDAEKTTAGTVDARTIGGKRWVGVGRTSESFAPEKKKKLLKNSLPP